MKGGIVKGVVGSMSLGITMYCGMIVMSRNTVLIGTMRKGREMERSALMANSVVSEVEMIERRKPIDFALA